MASEPPLVQQPDKAVVDDKKQPDNIISEQPKIVDLSANSVAVPLDHLKEFSATVDCPYCGNRAQTTTSLEVGSRAECAACLICCLLSPLLAWIPCVIPSCKDVEHFCAICKGKLAVWPRGAEITEVIPKQSPKATTTTQPEKQELAKNVSTTAEQQGVVAPRPEGDPDKIDQHPPTGTVTTGTVGDEKKRTD